MKKLSLLIAALLFATPAFAEPSAPRQKNLASEVCGTILNATTAVAIGAAPTGLDCESTGYSDGGAASDFADVAAAEAAVGTKGLFCVALSAAEMNFDYVKIKCTATNTNAAIWVQDFDTKHGTVLTNSTGQLDTGTIPETAFPARNTAQAATTTTLQLAAAEAFGDNELAYNTSAHIVSASTGAGQTKCIASNVGSTDTVTLTGAGWPTTPTGTIKYNLIPDTGCNALRPTVDGKTLDVTTNGNAGIDWGNIDNPTTTVNLSGSTISTVTNTTSASGSPVRSW